MANARTPPAATIQDVADTANLQRAVRFVLHDKDDQVIIDPLNDVPFLETLGTRIPDISAKLLGATYEPRRVTVVETARGNFTTRPVSYMEFEDWLVAQAILNVVAETLDSRIPSASYGFRLNPNRNKSNRHKFFKAWYREWPLFLRRIRAAVSPTYPCLVVTDIAGYFEHIDMRILSDMILSAGIPPETVNLIFSQLEKWTWREGFAISRGRGLLQGNDVASAYGNLYLSDIDEFLTSRGVKYQRFMDDFNIHCRDRTEGKTILRDLAKALRRKGLTLNTSKTWVLQGPEIDDHFSWQVGDDLEANLSELRASGDTPEVRHERQRLRRTILRLPVANPHLFKRLITAYTWARDRRFKPEALRLLVDAPDLTSNLCRYFRAIDSDADVVDLVDFLGNASRNIFSSQEQAIIETLLSMSIRGQPTRDRLMAVARGKLGDHGVDPYSRALYVLLVYKCGDMIEIERLVHRYLSGRERDILPRKHLALAVTRLNDPRRFEDVVGRLLREADVSLSEIGLFIEELRQASFADVRRVIINRTALSQDHYYHPPGFAVSRLRIRDLILLNICRQSQDARVRQLLRRRLRGWQSRVACPTSRQLLAEVEART